MDHKNQLPVSEVAPKAWDAILDVVGGEDRLETQVMALPESSTSAPSTRSLWSDAFIANFHRGVDQPWQPPSAQVGGWHKDGSYFRHFVDSREQALLTVVLWSDMLAPGRRHLHRARLGAGDGQLLYAAPGRRSGPANLISSP